MRALPDLAGGPIDLALLPIHGWGPRLSDGHMDPRAAAPACALAQVRAVLPIHYGTLHPVGFTLAGLGRCTAAPSSWPRRCTRLHLPPSRLLDPG